jgi:LETM1 and EF-hand domain-containing protein 1
MLVFVVIPFMELLLPVALKLFPNMLPSTFEDKLKKEEEMKQRIGARLEVARFLQDTVAEMASNMRRQRSGDNQTSAAELYQFMKRVRAGEPVAPAELLKFAQLFNDELTLDNLERVQLVSLCRFVGISPFGTDAFLRARLRSHLQDIKEDDREIQAEGMASLSEDELRTACRARGMRAPFGEGSAAFMRGQLAEWLDWSLNRSLPSSLLLLSRAFTVTAPIGKPAALDVSSIRETLSTLPDEAVEDVELFATSDGGDKTEAIERKLDLLEREEEMIREEEEYEAAVSAEAPPPSDRASGQEMAAAAAAVAVVRGAAAGSLAEMLDDSESAEERAARAAAAKEARMRNVLTCVPGCRLPSVFLCVCVCGALLECSPEERHVRPRPRPASALPPADAAWVPPLPACACSALAALASSSGVTEEREAFMSLVEKEIERLNEQMVRAAPPVALEAPAPVPPSAARARARHPLHACMVWSARAPAHKSRLVALRAGGPRRGQDDLLSRPPGGGPLQHRGGARPAAPGGARGRHAAAGGAGAGRGGEQDREQAAGAGPGQRRGGESARSCGRAPPARRPCASRRSMLPLLAR